MTNHPIRTRRFIIGDRVQGGHGEDHDTGRIVSVNGDMAVVAWDSGVTTPTPLADLSAA